MGSSKEVTVGYRYYMGLHFGLCHGPVDEVQEIIVGDRNVWCGVVTDNSTISINAGEIFGGDKKEGGIVGSLDLAMGGASQTANSYLTSKIGALIPAFRGILSAVYRGGQVSANNPYIKPWSFKVKRILQGWSTGAAWYPEKAVITNPSVTTCATVSEYDINLSVANAGESPELGHIITGLLPTDTVTIWRPNETMTYTAMRSFYEDYPGDKYTHHFSVGTDSGTPRPYWEKYFPSAEEALSDAMSRSPVVLTGSTFYKIYHYDAVPVDNAGGISLRIKINASAGRSIADMNPAHIIYQCLTDGVWGMGYPTSAIDNDSFTAAADKLYSESFGLSLLWNEQDTIESFIKIVLDHVGGILYVDPSTGKFALKLIRDDYVKESLPVYGPSNLISASDYQRQAWGETVNEISVVYTDALTGKDVSVTVQDLANIQTQGGVVAQAKQYPGIKSASLAQRVAMRDLIVTSTPLAKIKLTATRKAWSVIPGDVIRLTWPEYGIDDVVYRILEVNRGTLHNGEITIEAVEDVFGMPSNTYVASQDSGWEDPSTAPAAAPYRKLIETPYWDLARSLSAAELDYTDPLSGYLETLAVRPSGDSMDYEINTKTGSADYAERTTGQFCPSATLTVALTKTTTSITIENMVDVDIVEAGGYAIIDDEYIGISAIDATAGTATITRGVLDTVPDEHSIGARVWFADGFQGLDETEYADGETVDCKILPRTGQGELNISSAPVDSLTMDQRHNRPYPPGKVLVNGLIYPDWIGGDHELAITWAHRDRLLQTAHLVTQDEASIGPEAGVYYTMRMYGEADSLLRTYSGLSGTSQTYDNTTELSDGGSATEDPYWSSVKLLLNMNGADNGTTFTDSSATPKTITRYNAVTKTGVKKYGTASAYFDGNEDYLTIPHSEDFNLGSGDFTIELWFNRAGDLRFYSGAYFSVLLAKDTNGSGRTFWLRIYGTSATNAAGLQFAWSPDNGTTFYAATAEQATVIGVWYHLAVSRQAGVVRMYLDGTLVATGNNSVAGLFNSTSAVLSIGRDMWGTTEFHGYIDDLRITKGVARYTNNFTPPNQELGRYSYAARLNGRLRFELESVRYAGSIFAYYEVPQITGWDGTNWIGTLGVADAYLYKASPDLSAYTSLNLNLPYAMVAYGNGIYLALSANGPCKTSADGVTWTDQTGAPTGVQKLVYMGSQFVALGLYTIHTTTDGVTWTLKATLSYRPIDIAYSGSLWMVVGNHKTATQVFAATSSDLITWTDVSPTLTHWNGSNFLAEITSYGGKLQADFECVIYSGSAFYIGGRFVVDIEDQYRFHPLVYKYQSGVFTDCCPPLFGPVVVGSGYSVTSLAVVDTKIVAAGFRLAANATLATLTYSSWSMCTMPSTPAGVLDTSVGVTGNGTDAVLTTHMGGSNLITADGITFTATTGSIENNPVAVAPSSGVTSWQRHNHEVRRTGYGFNWGMYYG